MVRTNPSHLKETNFSSFNLRDAYVTDYVDYAAAIRDEYIFSNTGITVTVKVPKIENNVDEYSNFVDDDFIITSETVVPLFKQYRQNVSANGMSADGTDGVYPLQIILPTKLHLPRNSRIVLDEFNSREEKIAREWTVLGTEMLQLSGSKTYSRVANCVASRQVIQRTGEVEEVFGIGYFVINPVSNYDKISTIRSHWCSYFVINPIDSTTAVRRIIKETIQEEIDDVLDTAQVQEYINKNDPNLSEPQWQETLDYGILPNAKILKPQGITTEFVVKSTAISVLN